MSRHFGLKSMPPDWQPEDSAGKRARRITPGRALAIVFFASLLVSFCTFYLISAKPGVKRYATELRR